MMSNKYDRKKVGKSLQQVRKDAGFKSAKSFAETIGINSNTYMQYEQGLIAFNVETAWIMADALHCTLDELCGREFPRPNITYTDERQRIMNFAYEGMNEDGKTDVSNYAIKMSMHPMYQENTKSGPVAKEA